LKEKEKEETILLMEMIEFLAFQEIFKYEARKGLKLTALVTDVTHDCLDRMKPDSSHFLESILHFNTLSVCHSVLILQRR